MSLTSGHKINQKFLQVLNQESWHPSLKVEHLVRVNYSTAELGWMQDYEMFSLLILLPNFLQKSPNVRVFVLSLNYDRPRGLYNSCVAQKKWFFGI